MLLLFQVTIVEVVISDGGLIVSEYAFWESHVLVANTILALGWVHEERKGIWARLLHPLLYPYQGLLFDWREGRLGCVLSMVVARPSLV